MRWHTNVRAVDNNGRAHSIANFSCVSVDAGHVAAAICVESEYAVAYTSKGRRRRPTLCVLVADACTCPLPPVIDGGMKRHQQLLYRHTNVAGSVLGYVYIVLI